MTKKPSEKNKAWEKDRRARLNKSFEELAKILPKHDPSITWSKIEIIQKAVVHIKDLHERHEKYLRDKDPEVLKQYGDLIDALNYYQTRNGQLADLLQKANITLPAFKLPKFLIDNPQHYNNGHTKTTEIKTKPVGRPGKYSNNKISTENNTDSEQENDNKQHSNELSQTVQQDQNNDSDKNQTHGQEEQQNQQEHKQKDESTTVPQITTNTTTTTSTESEVSTMAQKKAIITTGILVPLVPLQPLQTIQQTTNPTVISQNISIPIPTPITLSPSSSTQHVSELPSQITCIKPPPVILPSSSTSSIPPTTTIIKIPSIVATNFLTSSQKIIHRLQSHSTKKVYRKIARDKDGRYKILPQPRLKVYFQRSDGKVPIPVLKKNTGGNIQLKRKRRRKRKVSTTTNENIESENQDEIKKKKLQEKEESQSEKLENSTIEKSLKDEVDCKDNNDKTVENSTEYQTTKKTNESSENTTSINEEKNVNLLIVDDNKKESLQDNSNNGSVSPTAAFLLSFPVVTTAATIPVTTATEPLENHTNNEQNIELNDKKSKILIPDLKEHTDSELNELTNEKIKNAVAAVDNKDSMDIDELVPSYKIDKIPVTKQNSILLDDTKSKASEPGIPKCSLVNQPEILSNNHNIISTTAQASIIPITTNEVSVPNLELSLFTTSTPSTLTTTLPRRPSFSTYKTMPICTPLPLPTTTVANNFPLPLPVCISTNTCTSNEVVPSKALESLPLIAPPIVSNLNLVSTISVFPPVSVSSCLRNISSSIVETTWCSLNTIPSTDIHKDMKTIPLSTSNSNLNQNPNTATSIATNINQTQQIPSISCPQTLPPTTNLQVNSCPNNTVVNLPNNSVQQNINLQKTTLGLSNVTSSNVISLPVSTAVYVSNVTTNVTTAPKKRQNSRRSNKTKTVNSLPGLVSTSPLTLPTHINTTISTISTSLKNQKVYPAYTFPSTTFNQNTNSTITTSYANFSNFTSLPSVSNSQTQSNSNKQLPKLQSIPSSLNDSQQILDNNLMYTSQVEFGPKTENTTIFLPQPKTNTFAQNPQLKSGNTTQIAHSKSTTTAVQNRIIDNNTSNISYVQTPPITTSFTSQNNMKLINSNTSITTAPVTTIYPQSNINTYYPLPPTEFLPPPTTSFQTSSATGTSNLYTLTTTSSSTLNCHPAYPLATNNPSSEFNPSPYCPNSFSRVPVSTHLPIHPLATTTTTSGFLFPNTFVQMPVANQMPMYAPANKIPASFSVPSSLIPSTTSLQYSQKLSNSKDNSVSSYYPNISSAPFVSTPNSTITTTTMGNVNPLKQTLNSNSFTSSLSTPYSLNSTSNPNIIYSTISNVSTTTTVPVSSKQSMKSASSPSFSHTIQRQNTKDVLPPPTSTIPYSSEVSTQKQTSSFKNYQQTNSHKSYAGNIQQNNNFSNSNSMTSSCPPVQYSSSSQNNSVSKSTSSTFTSQNSSSNVNVISSSSSSHSSTPSKSRISHTAPTSSSSSNNGPIRPQITPSVYTNYQANYPPPSLTPLPPPLLSTAIPISSNSFSNFAQNPGASVFGEPMETLKYPVSSSVPPSQNYNKTPAMQPTPMFINKSMNSFISPTPPTSVYANAPQMNPNYSVSNTFGSSGGDTIYSPVKNYYYHPIQMQDTPNFSFTLTSTTNTPSSVSSVPITVSTPHMPPIKPESVTWIPPPPPSTPSVNANNYKSTFTFSLTPSTTTVYTSVANNSISRPLSVPPQKISSSKSTASSKNKANYTNTAVSMGADISKSLIKSQPSVTNASNFTTNFTFSLTQSKNSLTNTENSMTGKSSVLNDISQQQQQQQQHMSFDRYHPRGDDLQNKQNPPPTNFSFALTNTNTTTSSNNIVPSATGIQQTVCTATTTIAATTKNTSSFTNLTSNLNQSSSNLCATQNLDNSKLTSSMSATNQIQSGSGVFKKPLIESSSSMKGLSTSNQNYYGGPYDQKLQKLPSTSLMHQKAPVNWMAPPSTTDFGAPPLIDYGCVPSYPTAQMPSAPQTFDYNTRKNDLYYPTPFASSDDNFSSWSPNKMLDAATSHLINSSTSLGNYYSDIPSFSSSGSSSNNTGFPVSSIQGIDSSKSIYSTTARSSNKILTGSIKDFKDSNGTDSESSNVSNIPQQSSFNQNNFLSVSQLVDQDSTMNNAQKNYDNCTNSNSNANSNNSGNKKTSSSTKSKDNKKFNASITTYPSEQGNIVNPSSNAAPVGSNNYSAEALLTKKEKNTRNYSNVCNSDFYGSMNTSNTFYPSSSSSTSSLIPDPNMDSNYFYNYATNTGGCLSDADYLGSIYPSETTYSRSPSIKPIRKISSSIPPASTPQAHHPIPHHSHPPPPPTNFVPYDANYYPVPLGVNSPLMPGPAPPHPHQTSDPFGTGAIMPASTPAPHHPYIHHHPPSGNFQTHSWGSSSSKPSNTINTLNHNQYNIHEHHGQQQQQQQHLFHSTELHGNHSSSSSSNSNTNSGHSSNNNNNSGQNHSTAAVGSTGTVANPTGNSGSGGSGNNLTNFNLTTICPEINNDKVGSNPW